MGAFDTSRLLIHRLLSAANSANPTLVVGRRATLKLVQGHNAKAAVVYLKIYDKVTAPAETDTPLMTIYLPASSSFIFNYEHGIEAESGLGYRLVTDNADNGTTAIAAGDILALNIGYAL